METEVEAFVRVLINYIEDALKRIGDMEYCREAVRIADVRNHIFYCIADAATDEEHSIFPLRDLCHLDADTMMWNADTGRIISIARDLF